MENKYLHAKMAVNTMMDSEALKSVVMGLAVLLPGVTLEAYPWLVRVFDRVDNQLSDLSQLLPGCMLQLFHLSILLLQLINP